MGAQGGKAMSQTPAQIAHQQKIQAAKHRFETDGGKAIDPAHVTEWALLEIAQMLDEIRYQVTMMNMPRPSSSTSR
jgi:hypothetical protein